MGEPLRGGVIGAGVFGGHHARKYAGAKGAVLSAVLDTHHPDRAAAFGIARPAAHASISLRHACGACWRSAWPSRRRAPW